MSDASQDTIVFAPEETTEPANETCIASAIAKLNDPDLKGFILFTVDSELVGKVCMTSDDPKDNQVLISHIVRTIAEFVGITGAAE